MDDARTRAMFAAAGCTGACHVSRLDGASDAGSSADDPMVAASVFKVAVALEAERRFATGALDPEERVRLDVTGRTPGPVGFSLFRDPVEVSLRDLVAPMLTISDNVATDVLLERIGLDAVNSSLRALGLRDTVVTGTLRSIVDSLGRHAGFADWEAFVAWSGDAPADDRARVGAALPSADELSPSRATRTTARDMVTLLRLIWTDAAAPAVACGRVRELMARQLTRDRLADAFPPEVRISAKSGGLLGVVRNEVGVIEFPDGEIFAAAVFTRSAAHADPRPVNAVIGTVAAHLIDGLRG